MAKKKQRSKQVSKGVHCQDKSLYRAIAREKSPIDNWVNLVKEWRKGKNPWITVINPNDKDTRARKIRVRANDYYGDWKHTYTMKTTGADQGEV